MDFAMIDLLDQTLEVGAYLGSWLFYAGVILYNIGVFLSKQAFGIAFFVFQNAATVYAFFGYCATSVFSYCSSFSWNVLLFCCGAFLHFMDYLSRTSITIWNTPFCDKLRQLFGDGARSLLALAWQSPIFFIRTVLTVVAVILISIYWRDIWELMVLKKNECKKRIVRTKNQIAACGVGFIQFVTHPLSALGCFRAAPVPPKGSSIDRRQGRQSASKKPARPSPSTRSSRNPQVMDLESENSKLRNELHREREARRCVVCLTDPREIVCLPCNHLTTCEECFKELFDTCPVCRRKVRKTIKVFL